MSRAHHAHCWSNTTGAGRIRRNRIKQRKFWFESVAEILPQFRRMAASRGIAACRPSSRLRAQYGQKPPMWLSQGSDGACAWTCGQLNVVDKCQQLFPELRRQEDRDVRALIHRGDIRCRIEEIPQIEVPTCSPKSSCRPALLPCLLAGSAPFARRSRLPRGRRGKPNKVTTGSRNQRGIRPG